MSSHGSDGHQAAVAYLLLFVLMWFYWTLNPIVHSIPSWGPPPKARVYLMLTVDVLLLVTVARYLRTWSLLWQVPLQALALVFLVTGLSGLVGALFHNRHLLAEREGAWFGGCLVTAVVLGALMRRLQWRFLDGRHRHLTTAWSAR